MILSTNAYNWAMLRSGLSMGDFAATLTPEREMELFKAYNAWRKGKGLAEEAMPIPAAPSAAPSPSSAPEKKTEEDPLSALINEVASEVEEEEAEEVALIQDALDGADEIVEEAAEPVPVEVEEEIEAEEPVEEEADVPEVTAEPDVATTSVMATSPAVDFATVIRSLPKEADPALYNRIKDQFGEETKSMAQAVLKEATAKHRATAAIRAFLGWLNDV